MNEAEDIPRSKDIERAVIGACILSSDGLSKACEIISEEMFYFPQHRLLFEILRYFMVRSMKYDELVIVEELEKRGQLEQVGGQATIAGLMAETASAANIEHHCKIVKEKYQYRQLIILCNAISGEAYDGKSEIGDVINKANTMLDKLLGEDQKRGFFTLKEMLTPAINAIQKANASEGITGIPTGFPTLNNLTNGWQNGDTIVIGAHKKAGKSMLSSIFASEAISKGYKVGLFTLEMTRLAITKRFLSYHARVNTTEVHYKKLDNDDFEKLTEAGIKLSNYPVLVGDDSAGITIEDVMIRAKRMKKIYDIDFLIVDYIQLMPSSGTESRQREIEKISHGLKAIAKNLDIPVLIVSQLARPQKGKEGHAPLMTDLRDSSSLEADASVILLIYEPDEKRKKELVKEAKCNYEENDVRYKYIRELIVAGNREGNTGSIPMTFHGEHAFFGELGKDEN